MVSRAEFWCTTRKPRIEAEAHPVIGIHLDIANKLRQMKARKLLLLKANVWLHINVGKRWKVIEHQFGAHGTYR